MLLPYSGHKKKAAVSLKHSYIFVPEGHDLDTHFCIRLLSDMVNVVWTCMMINVFSYLSEMAV
jgi:hypothetical protein